MNSYKLRYYNSGGYKSSQLISTQFTINRDSAGKLQVLDISGVRIGGAEYIEKLLSDELGWVEDNCVFEAKLVENLKD